ncbi:MAG TPA: general secretion pathway protein GspB [Steroidobacteraceae bacterium]|nr:general secretion pathway protein GspB [Steroidobacteraceae bacterium]
MSFILDALKKSESDRQRQSGPSLFEVKVAPPRRRLPVWAVAIAVLLGVNVIVVSWMLLRRPAAQQTQQPQRAQPAPAGNPLAAAPPAATHPPAASGGTAPMSVAGGAPAGPAGGTAPASSAAAAPASTAATAQAPAAGAQRSSQPAAGSPPAGGDDQSAGRAAPGGDPSDYAPAVEPAGAQGSGAAAAADGLPLYQQIVTSDGLPALHLDLHVFAERPQDRFVMINMHRLGEGDSLPGGVQVDAIRPDGVVLTYRGTRFLLPRN